MSRPVKKGLDYFSHDVSMSEDIKLKKLETKFGLSGYAVYNKILEQQFKYGGEFSLENEDDLLLYCRTWSIKREKLLKIIQSCIALGLFQNEKLLSPAISERLEKINFHRKARRERFSTKIGEENKNNNLETISTMQNSEQTPQSKVKERKEKESKVNCDVAQSSPDSPTHIFEFETFHKFLQGEHDYKKLCEYDLEYYFSRVINFYPGKNFTLHELKMKVNFFIENDNKSDKHSPKKISKPKPDAIAAAYELVKNNLSRIKNFESKDSRDIVSMLLKGYNEPPKNNPLFEGYVEKALGYYVT